MVTLEYTSKSGAHPPSAPAARHFRAGILPSMRKLSHQGAYPPAYYGHLATLVPRLELPALHLHPGVQLRIVRRKEGVEGLVHLARRLGLDRMRVAVGDPQHAGGGDGARELKEVLSCTRFITPTASANMSSERSTSSWRVGHTSPQLRSPWMYTPEVRMRTWLGLV